MNTLPLNAPATPTLQTHLRDYVHIVLKRKWAALSLWAAVIVGATLYVAMQPPVFQSTVSLLVEPTGPNVLSKNVEEVYAPINVNIDYYKTQYEILKSHQILRDAVRRLNLKDHREYTAKPGPLEQRFNETKGLLSATITALVGDRAGEAGAASADGEAERRLVEAFRGNVTVKPVVNSRIIRVSVESVDPRLAADAANTIAAVYISRSLEMKVGAAEEASKWISARVEELRRKVQESEETLAAFAREYGLISVDERKRLVTQKLGDLNAQLVQAETKRVEAQARYRQIESVLGNPDELEASAEVLSSSLIHTLRAQETQAAQKVAELSDKYGPKHPSLIQASSELREVQSRIQLEIKKIYASVKAEYEVAVARERVIRNALNQQKSDVMTSAQYEVQYGILDREAQSNRQLYEMFLKRMKETDIATEIRTSNIYVADPAIVSFVAAKPKKTQFVLIAAALGLLAAVVLTFFLDYMDSSFKSLDDIAYSLPEVAVLGHLPVYGEKKLQAGPDLASHEAPHSSFAECVRSIRTSLLLSAADNPPRSILVTSAIEGEGKSTFAINLAVTLSQLGQPTVLIEADLRKPRLGQVMGNKPKKGLSHYLVGAAGLEEVMQPTPVPHLRFIPCGAIPPNPAELLQSKHMADLLERFKREGVYVVLDCSPVLAVTDPRILGHLVDGAIMVVRAARTPRQAVRMAVRKLVDSQTRLLGIVLQQLASRDFSPYGGYYLYYGKGYKKRPYGRKPDPSLVKSS